MTNPEMLQRILSEAYDPESNGAYARIFEDDSEVEILKPPIAVDKDFPKR